jgi:anthraniloyl-CoA monooxygenase
VAALVKVRIVGGGPAGLYFAILLKRLSAAHDVTVFERDGPDDTFGWGIVFSDQTCSYLRNQDEASHRAISDGCVRWDNVDVVHRGTKVTIRGNRFSGIQRLRFLKILQARCSELGVALRFNERIDESRVEKLRDCDLLVGADGANSLVRRLYAPEFQPSLGAGANKYIWLGTTRLFHGLTLTFRRSDAGPFAAHSYMFSPTHSTFIVECGETTWKAAGFDRMNEIETCRYLERVFVEDLNGQPLLSNNFVKWLNFLMVRNARWRYDNVVLLGDALHTAHFSIGSGTKLALEDAIVLAGALSAERDVRTALERFERERKPIIEEYQQAARESQVWFEQTEKQMAVDPLELAYQIMTRSKKIDRENLRRRDPAFVAAYERAHG